MATASQRKKQPEVVRQKLLDCTSRILVERGTAGLTVQAVAEAAGVTKGGLLHHFPSKQKLLEGVFAELLRLMDAEIDDAMARDPSGYGRFTRAYVRSTLCVDARPGPNLCTALSLSMLTELPLRRAWGDWLKARLLRHQDTDADPSLQFVRYAADGVWLAELLGQDAEQPKDRPALLAQMLDRTRAVNR
jgi:AcrR family transcriptional regulator